MADTGIAVQSADSKMVDNGGATTGTGMIPSQRSISVNKKKARPIQKNRKKNLIISYHIQGVHLILRFLKIL